MVAEMGGLAEKRDRRRGRGAGAPRHRPRPSGSIAADPAIDALQREIEEKAVLTIARRQPMAVDLREIVAALRIANDLERIGDLAKNIAKRVDRARRRVPAAEAAARRRAHGRAGARPAQAGARRLRQPRRRQGARRSGSGDEEIDALYTSLFRELLTYMMEDPRNITFCTHLLFCAKNIERIGDHATNIAETVYYMVEGTPIADQRPKGDTTSLRRPCRAAS